VENDDIFRFPAFFPAAGKRVRASDTLPTATNRIHFCVRRSPPPAATSIFASLPFSLLQGKPFAIWTRSYAGQPAKGDPVDVGVLLSKSRRGNVYHAGLLVNQNAAAR
jgi:hypothetical protein